MTVNFGYLLQLDNGLAEALFANQPSRRFDDVSAGNSRFLGGMLLQSCFVRDEIALCTESNFITTALTNLRNN